MPEVHADGALWGRARKGWYSGTGAGFLWSRARKGAVLGTGVASVRPDVPKASGQRARYAEVWKGSVQFYRTSTVIGVIWQKSTEVRKE